MLSTGIPTATGGARMRRGAHSHATVHRHRSVSCSVAWRLAA
jgi:hypothetical protein